ncbi:MAG: hypothetical protein WAL40_20040, partial [Rhodoplanes sp.]
DLSHVTIIYLIPVLVAAIRGGILPALVAALAGISVAASDVRGGLLAGSRPCAQDWRKKGSLALEHAGHVTPERGDERGEHYEVNRDLNPAIDGHGAPLRTARDAAARK